jgi:uncharacterized pyridoxamine 5'-phosphate oxidase family protein
MIAVRTTIDYLRKQSKHLSLNGETQEEISLKENIISENPLLNELFPAEYTLTFTLLANTDSGGPM